MIEGELNDRNDIFLPMYYALLFTSRAAARSSKAFRWFLSWEDVFLSKIRWFLSWEDGFLFFVCIFHFLPATKRHGHAEL